MGHHKLYIAIIGIVFAAFTVVFLTFPRSSYSELEKRELATFPEFSSDGLLNNTFTSKVSVWFSDSEPFRDKFMAASMGVRNLIRLNLGDEEAVSFHKADSSPVTNAAAGLSPTDNISNPDNPLADEKAKIGHAGIMIVGTGPNVRALMAYGGDANGGTAFARTLNTYKSQLGNVNVYAMVIPLASEFYTPEKARSATKPQLPTIRNIAAHLDNGVKNVDAYSALQQHIDQDIYLRTDHHWAPLGAFYAAKQFAATAGVPFRDLSAYDKKTVHRFVGSMFGYSQDIAVKNAPEDFVYYVPKNVTYSTTYRNYSVNKDYQVTGEGRPVSGPYFSHFKDGSSGAYSTFMGGDQKLTKVKTGTNNGRRLIVIKDSYGNALPGYLFYSFEEIHVVDFRYFTHNLKQYARDNKITDIVFCVNIFNAYSPNVAQKMLNLLNQREGNYAPKDAPEKKQEEPQKETPQKENTPASEPASQNTETTEPAPSESSEE